MKKCNLIIVFVFAVAAHAQTNKTVLPPGFENVNGNSQDGLFVSVQRYQELFRASSVAPLWQTPISITALSFRVADGVSSSMDAVIPRIEIRMSTTSRAPEQMSTLYTENRGPDEAIVFSHTNVPLFGRAGPGPNPFDVRFEFDRPFQYDSAAGHLLIYFDTSGGPGTKSLDAHLYGSLDANSPVASFGGGGFGAPTAYGLIAQFEWVAIPEPNAVCLFAAGFVLAITLSRKMD